jgi:hypothetical protein
MHAATVVATVQPEGMDTSSLKKKAKSIPQALLWAIVGKY